MTKKEIQCIDAKYSGGHIILDEEDNTIVWMRASFSKCSLFRLVYNYDSFFEGYTLEDFKEEFITISNMLFIIDISDTDTYEYGIIYFLLLGSNNFNAAVSVFNSLNSKYYAYLKIDIKSMCDMFRLNTITMHDIDKFDEAGGEFSNSLIVISKAYNSMVIDDYNYLDSNKITNKDVRCWLDLQ